MLRGLLYAVAAIKVVAAIKGVQNGDQNAGSGSGDAAIKVVDGGSERARTSER